MVSKEPSHLLTGQTNGKSTLADKLPGTMTVRSVLLNRDSPDIESRLKKRRNRTHQVRFKDLEDGSSSSGNSGTGENNSHQRPTTDCDSPHPLRKHGRRTPLPWADEPHISSLPGQTSVVGAVRGDMASTIEVVAAFLARAPPHPLTPGPTRRCWTPPQANSLTLPMTRKTSTAIQTSPCLKKPLSTHTRSHSLGDSVGIDGDDEHDSQDEYFIHNHMASHRPVDLNGPNGCAEQTTMERRSKLRTEMKSAVTIVKNSRQTCPPAVTHIEPCHCSSVASREGPKRQGSSTPSVVRRRKRLSRTTSDPGKEVHYCTTPTQTESRSLSPARSSTRLCTTQVQTESPSSYPDTKYSTTQIQTESHTESSPITDKACTKTKTTVINCHPTLPPDANLSATQMPTKSSSCYTPATLSTEPCTTQPQTKSQRASPILTTSVNTMHIQSESLDSLFKKDQAPLSAQTTTVPYCTTPLPPSLPTQISQHCANLASSTAGKSTCTTLTHMPLSCTPKRSAVTPDVAPPTVASGVTPPTLTTDVTPATVAPAVTPLTAILVVSPSTIITDVTPPTVSSVVTPPTLTTDATPPTVASVVTPTLTTDVTPLTVASVVSPPTRTIDVTPPAAAYVVAPTLTTDVTPHSISPVVTPPSLTTDVTPHSISPVVTPPSLTTDVTLPAVPHVVTPPILTTDVTPPSTTPIVTPPTLTTEVTPLAVAPVFTLPTVAPVVTPPGLTPPILATHSTPPTVASVVTPNCTIVPPSATPDTAVVLSVSSCNTTLSNIVPTSTFNCISPIGPTPVVTSDITLRDTARHLSTPVNIIPLLPNATSPKNLTPCTFVTQTAISCTSISYCTTTHPVGPSGPHPHILPPAYATLVQTVSHCNIPCQVLQNAVCTKITPYTSPVPKLKSSTSPPILVKTFTSNLPIMQQCVTPTKTAPLYSSTFRAAPPYTPPCQTQDKRGIRLPPPPPPPPPYTPRKNTNDPPATQTSALRTDNKTTEKDNGNKDKKEDQKCKASPQLSGRASSLKHRAQTPPAAVMKGGGSPAKACFKSSCLSSAHAQLGVLHKMLCSGASTRPSTPQQFSLPLSQQGCSGARRCSVPVDRTTAGPLTPAQADTLRQVQEILGGLMSGAKCKLDPSKVTEKLLSPNGPLRDIRSLQTQLQSLEGVLETSQNTIKVLLDVIQDLEKKEAVRDGRHTYRTGQDIENCGTCRDCACIIYSVEHDFRLQEGQVVRTWKVGDPPEGRPQTPTPPPATPHQQDSPQAVRPPVSAKKNRKKCFWFL